MNPLDLLHGLRLDDGRRWGEAATLEQRTDAAAILDPDSATPYHWCSRGRGYSKTTDLAGVLAAAMLALLRPGSRLYAVAADLDQGRLLVDALAGFAARTPEIRSALEVNAYRIAAPRSGTVLEVLPADGPSAWGLRPAFLVVDELAGWASTPGARKVWEATTSSVAKASDCRMVVLTTAGDPAHWSRRVLDHALEDPLWRVHEVPGPAPWLDEARLAEQRRRLPESLYLRLFENRWVSSEDRLVAEEDLAACVTLDGPQDPISGMRYTIGVDVGLKRDATVAVVAHLENGVAWLDRIAVWRGTRLRPVRLGEVEEWLTKAAREYSNAQVVIDPWQAAQLTERLRRRSVRVDEFPFTAQSVGRIASTLYLQLRERSMRLPDDEALLDELRNVRLRETSPGVLRLDHDSGRHDDRAVALALAVHRLIEKGEPQPTTISVPTANLRDRRVRRTLRVAAQQASKWDPTAGMRRQPDPVEETLAQHGVVVARVDPDAWRYQIGGPK